jgi:acyl-CoA dehydrogenase
MFIMMNEARFSVGLQGIAIAERAFQQAQAYADERVQGRDAVSGQDNVPIAVHPDVRRMLGLMQTRTQAARMLAYWVAGRFDIAHAHPEPHARERAGRLVDVLIPIVKGWSTEVGNDSASLGVQIHGGMGFIEETGAAQHMRDARILTIYEGTTGIQANDLVVRKLLRDGGEGVMLLLREILDDVEALTQIQDERIVAFAPRLSACIRAFEHAARTLTERARGDLGAGLWVAVPFLTLAGIACGAWMWAKAARAAHVNLTQGRGDAVFQRAQIAQAGFYMAHVATQADGLAAGVVEGMEASARAVA